MPLPALRGLQVALRVARTGGGNSQLVRNASPLAIFRENVDRPPVILHPVVFSCNGRELRTTAAVLDDDEKYLATLCFCQ